MKRCKRCNKKYDISFFSRDLSTSDGLSIKCKQCSGSPSINHNTIINECYPDNEVKVIWNKSKQLAMISIWDANARRGMKND